MADEPHARTGAVELAGARLTDVVSTLHGFAITTYDVEPALLAALLPRGLVPEVFRLDDGRERAFVSAVTFRNEDFRVGFAPFVRLVAEQTNFRAYVMRGTERCVYFFGTTLGSPFVLLPWLFWRLPWAYGRHEVTFAFEAERCTDYDWAAHSAHGLERLRASGTGEALSRLDGFVDAAQTAHVLTHPLVGYLCRRDGPVVTYGVDHARLAMEVAEVREARFELFERLGLVRPGDAPHSVLILRRTEFIVRLPPHRAPELGPVR